MKKVELNLMSLIIAPLSYVLRKNSNQLKLHKAFAVHVGILCTYETHFSRFSPIFSLYSVVYIKCKI